MSTKFCWPACSPASYNLQACKYPRFAQSEALAPSTYNEQGVFASITTDQVDYSDGEPQHTSSADVQQTSLTGASIDLQPCNSSALPYPMLRS